MIGIKGKGAKVINIPPMDIKKYGKLPYDRLKIFRFKIRGLEEARAGSFLQYNLLLNKHVISAFVDFSTHECHIVTDAEEKKEDIEKLITESKTYSASEFLKYEAEFDSEEEVSYVDVLKNRFNLEFIE